MNLKHKVFMWMYYFLTSISNAATTEHAEILHYDESTKISFFGGSVTQQGKESGYVVQFKKLHPELNVFQHGYGGQQIYNAGICYIDEILELSPDVLFLDWSLLPFENCSLRHSGGTLLSNFIEKSTLVILRKCKDRHIFPVFIHMGRTDNIVAISKLVIDEVARKYHVPCIEMNEIHKDSLALMFRDSFHTNEIGAKNYAQTIKHFLAEQTISFPFLGESELDHFEFPLFSINSIIINKNIKKKFSFRLNGVLVGISQTIGPFSGSVIMKVGDAISQNFKISDQWCYFERETIKICPLMPLNELIEFTLGNDSFNPDCSPEVKIKSLFFTGLLTDFYAE